jgi:hypothetical protein
VKKNYFAKRFSHCGLNILEGKDQYVVDFTLHQFLIYLSEKKKEYEVHFNIGVKCTRVEK